jgi:hypothetical protein
MGSHSRCRGGDLGRIGKEGEKIKCGEKWIFPFCCLKIIELCYFVK